MRHVFVISDLIWENRPDKRDAKGTLRPGFQICYAYQELIEFVDWVAPGKAAPREHDLELVINGDVVDFLAEDDFDDPSIRAEVWTPDERHAITKLDRVADRTRGPNGRGFFEALRDLLGRGTRLTLVLGNHDADLRCQGVHRHLVALLGGESAHLRIVYDGEAYTVGPMLIEHGNRYDGWNMVNHSSLRQERSMVSRGLPVNEAQRAERYFVAPAGPTSLSTS